MSFPVFYSIPVQHQPGHLTRPPMVFPSPLLPSDVREEISCKYNELIVALFDAVYGNIPAADFSYPFNLSTALHPKSVCFFRPVVIPSNRKSLNAKASSSKKKVRRYNQLTIEERIALQILLNQDEYLSLKEIGDKIHRSKSTIHREIHQFSFGETIEEKRKNYRACTAARGRVVSRSRSRKKGKFTEEIIEIIEKQLKLSRSPQQMLHAGLGLEISFSSIYKAIHRGIIFKSEDEATKYLRFKGRRKNSSKKSKYSDSMTVRDRGNEIISREEFGHWECDSIISSGRCKRCIMVFYERKTRYVHAFFESGCTADNFYNRLKYMIKKYPKGTFKSITVDRGSEFAKYKDIEKLGVKVFFADPHSPWQKGGVENVNGLIREYYTKETSFAKIPWQDLTHRVLVLINLRPRAVCNWKIPMITFDKQINLLQSQVNSYKRSA